MNSRFVPITTGVGALAIAVCSVIFIDGLWHWLIASPLLWVSYISLKVGIFYSQDEVDKMTGADKLNNNRSIMFPAATYIIVFQVAKYIVICVLFYSGFAGISSLVIIPLAALLLIIKSFEPLRFNIIRSKLRERSRLSKSIMAIVMFFAQDLIMSGVVFGLGLLIAKALLRLW